MSGLGCFSKSINQSINQSINKRIRTIRKLYVLIIRSRTGLMKAFQKVVPDEQMFLSYMAFNVDEVVRVSCLSLS